MGAQSSKHSDVLEAVANNDSRRIKSIFSDKVISPLLLVYVLSANDVTAIFPQPPKPFENRPEWAGLSPLHYAVEQKNTRALEEIARLLKDCTEKRLELPKKTVQYTDIWGVRDVHGLTPLSRAVRAKNLRSIQVLALAGANLNEAHSSLKDDRMNNECWSHVRYAAVKGLTSTLACLLDAGADFETWGSDGRRPIHLAVEAGQIETVKELLERDRQAEHKAKSNRDGSSDREHNLSVQDDEASDDRQLQSIARYLVRESTPTLSEEPPPPSITVEDERLDTNGNQDPGGSQTLDAIRSALRDPIRGAISVARVAHQSNRERGGNLLHLACASSHPHIAEYLLSLAEFKQSVEEMNDSGKTPVFMAIRSGSVKCLKLLADAGADIHKKDIESWTAIHEAVKGGNTHIGILECLINDFQMNANAIDDDGWAPLHVAARFGSTDAVDVLVQAGADINAVTEDKESAVLLASAQVSSAEVLRKLLSHGADVSLDSSCAMLRRKDFKQFCIVLDHMKTLGDEERRKALDIDFRAESGNTILHMCVMNSCAEATQKLLELGALPNEENHEGLTPLHIATNGGEAEIVRTLLEGGANPDILRPDGMAPLHIACDGGHIDVVSLLMNAKCDLNLGVTLTARYKGFTPLMFASRLGSSKIASMLIEGGADLAVAKGDGFTALHLAALNGNAKVCRILIRAGANYAVADESGYLPLQLATRQGQLDVVGAMLEEKVAPNCRGKLGLTALHVAAYMCDARLIWILIRGGADVNAINDDDVTPLHVAAGREQGRVGMQLLLSNDAKIEMRDKEEDTPLHNACYRGLHQNARLLLRRGAEPSPANENGVTPLHLAAAFGNEETVEALLTYGADIEARDQNRMTPYRVAAEQKHRQAMILLFRAMKLSLAEIAPRRTFETVSPNTSSDELLCVICQSPLTSGDATRTLPCNHTYHDDCILAWLGGEELLQHNSCPLCQKSILPEGASPGDSISTSSTS